MQFQFALGDGHFQVRQQRKMGVRACLHCVVETYDRKLLDPGHIERHIGAAHHGGEIKSIVAQLRPAHEHAHVNGLLDHMQRQVKLRHQMLQGGFQFRL